MSKKIEKPAIGAQAPAFTLPVIGGEYKEETIISLADFKGSKVLLYFYPKDSTPGCTVQACALRDDWSEVEATGLKVFGVSPDKITSHQKFIDKQSLPFALISDTEKTLATDYGVWVEKSMYGKFYLGVERSSFIIDEEGNLEAILEKVKPKEHLSQVLALINK